MSVAHGIGFEFAGKEIANHPSMSAAMKLPAMLAVSQGSSDA